MKATIILPFGFLILSLLACIGGPLDVWQWRNPTPQGNTLYAVAYGNGMFVAGGQNGIILTSPDAATWTKQNSPFTNTINTIIFTNGVFAAAGPNQFATSTNATDWSVINPGTNVISGLAYGNGTWVASVWVPTVFGYSTRAMLSSTNGTDWVSHDTSIYDGFNGVAFNNGTFVAVGGKDGGNIIDSIPDKHLLINSTGWEKEPAVFPRDGVGGSCAARRPPPWPGHRTLP